MLATTARLAHESYWHTDFYARDCRDIFARHWIYVGLRADFDHGPVTCDIAGTRIMVVLEAGPASDSGIPKGWHASDPSEPVRVALCGQLVFCCLDNTTEPLEAYLAPYTENLRLLSCAFGLADNRESLEVAANWKTLIENTLDDYHVPVVHAESFKRPMHPDWPSRMVYERPGRHTVQQWDLNDDAVAVWSKLDRHARFKRYSAYTGYRHYFIFPNFYVSTAYGTMAVLHRILPRAPEHATIEWSICLPLAAPDNAVSQAIKARVLPGLVADARRIVTEDLSVCELAQKGRRFAPYPGLLGGREARLIDFQTAITATYASSG